MKKLISFIATSAILLNSLVTPLSALAQEVSSTPTPEETIVPAENPISAPSTAPIDFATPTPNAVNTSSETDLPTSTDLPTDTQVPESIPTTPGPPTEIPSSTPQEITGNETLNDTYIENVDLSGVTRINSNVLDSGTITTDKSDYSPTSIVLITGSGFIANKTYTINIASTDEPPSDFTDQVKADESGNISYAYQLDGKPRLNYTIYIKNGENVVTTTTFTDPSDSLNQCGNGTLASPDPTPCQSDSEWENGNLGASKSHYFEGDTIPYRLTMTGLSVSGSHTATIEWDTTKGGNHAMDYITTFNNTVAADPCAGISGCSSFSTFAIPVDLQVSGAGVTPIPGSFRLYGGTITGVSGYSYSNGAGFAGDKSARITITFTTTVSNPVLAWGGHIADRADWGDDNSAVSISGSPYHTRSVDIDGSGGNQDRSLSADAVIFPASITVIKEATPEGSTSFPFTASPTPLTNFSLIDNGTAANTKLFSNITDFKEYTITESVPAGWSLDDISCTVTSPNDGTQEDTIPSLVIDLKEGEDVTCTFTNTLQQGTLTVQKTTIPAADPTVFTINATGSGTVTEGGAGTISDTSDKSYTVTAGTYYVSKTVPDGWNKTGDTCQGVVVEAGGTSSCTITNTKLGKIIVEKQTLPDGSPQSFSFTPNYGQGFSLTDGQTNDSGYLSPGTYSVAETVPGGWTQTSATCSDGSPIGAIALAAGETVTCTFNNTQKGHIVVDKVTNPTGSQQSFAFTTTGTGYTGFSLKDGDTPNSQEVLPGSYTVAETSVNGWDSNGGLCDNGETAANLDVEPGETVTCTFTNTQRGNISGYKYDDANGDGVNSGDWTPVTGWVIELWKDGVFTQQTATTNGSGFYSFTNLIQGAYQLIEQVLGGWAKVLPISGTINVTLDAGENDTGNNFVNTRYGTIIIEKQTIPNSDSQVFDFDKNTFGGGDADLSDGQQDTTNNLLPGGYSITESPVTGWQNTSTVCTSSKGDTETAGNLELDSGETITCVFTNTKLPKLTVTKTVINHGLNYDTSHFAPYQVDTTPVTLGQANIFSIGPHTVTEVEDPNYNATFGGVCDASGNVTLAAGDDLTCTITNEEVSTSLTFVKTVTNNNGGGALPTDWTLSASGPTNISGKSGDASITNANVNSGVYTLSESGGPANYTAGSWSCIGGSLTGDQLTLSSGQSATCTINNNDDAPKLRLVKSVTNDNGGTSVATNWTLTATGTGQSPSNLLGQGSANSGVSFKADTYTLAESGPSGYTAGSWDCGEATMTDANHVVVPFGGDITCRINNNDNTPSLTLVKTVINHDGGTAVPSNWTLTATGPTGFSGAGPTVNNGASFDAGTYTLSESGLNGYSAGDWICVKNGGNPVTRSSISLALGDAATCTITNDDITPTLKLVKSVTKDNGGNETPGDWDLTATGSALSFTDDGDSNTFHQVKAGIEYTLSESTMPGYNAGSWSCNNGNLAGDKLTLGLAENATCTITNDDIAPKLTIIKDPTNDNGGSAFPDDFLLTVGGASVLSGVENTYSANTAYAINETQLDGYSFVSISGDKKCPSVLDGTITLDEGDDITCTITNDDEAPTITLIKNVIGENNPDLNSFGLTIDGVSVNSGVATDVEANTPITINEAGKSGYTFTSINGDEKCPDVLNGTVTLNEGEDITCTITNTKYGFMQGRKYIDTNLNGELEQTEAFLDGWTINLYDEEWQPITTQLTGSEGLLEGQYRFDNLLPGIYYVCEASRTGWQQMGPELGSNPVNYNNNQVNGSVAVNNESETPNEAPICWQSDINGSEFGWLGFGNIEKGHIIVDKVTDPTGDSQVFSFDASGSNYSDFELTGRDSPNNQELLPGVYGISEIQTNGWGLTDATCTSSLGDNETTDRLDLNAGETITCTFNNLKLNPQITITKSNDRSGGTTAGSTVTYTLTVTNDGNVDLQGVDIIDILPGGFSFVAGSTTGTAIVPTVSGSVITWNNVGDLAVGASFILTYQATISTDSTNGLYTNFATCDSYYYDGGEERTSVPCNTANSTVSIGSVLGYGGSLQGQVLGASTELPATGSPTLVLIVALVMLATGLFLNGFTKRETIKIVTVKRKKKAAKKHAKK